MEAAHQAAHATPIEDASPETTFYSLEDKDNEPEGDESDGRSVESSHSVESFEA
jgi:hypothetical protein